MLQILEMCQSKCKYSLIQMPDDNYVPRKDDTRVGYFTTKSNNMTSLYRLNYRDFINRWRLEKKIQNLTNQNL